MLSPIASAVSALVSIGWGPWNGGIRCNRAQVVFEHHSLYLAGASVAHLGALLEVPSTVFVTVRREFYVDFTGGIQMSNCLLAWLLRFPIVVIKTQFRQECFAVRPDVDGMLDVSRKTFLQSMDDIFQTADTMSEECDYQVKVTGSIDFCGLFVRAGHKN